MKFTDIFVQRPVLASVVSLLILVVGLRSIFVLSVREFPFTENGIITIETPYIGANPEVIESFVTTTIEDAAALSNGIEYMTSISGQGMSTISVFLRLNYDTDKAMTEINANVSSVINQLPPGSQLPQLSIDVGEATDLMYIAFYSEVLSRGEVTDYVYRIAQPAIRAVNQVLDAELLGYRRFALRAWLDPQKLAAYGLTPNDIYNVLYNNDVLSAAGRSDGQMIAVNLTANTNLTSLEDFRDLSVGFIDGANIKLSDVATISLGAENYDSAVSFDGKTAVFVGVQVVPDGNVLAVIDEVRHVVHEMQEELPEGIKAEIIYDATQYIHKSISEVVKALLEATFIVILVVLAFLGSLRSAMIPIVAIPLSLIGTFFMMHLFGYSINLLTLLSLVLAIGLVVDDAIIMVENIDRHIREGLSPLKASIIGARELANPIIAISIVLIAVYLPIGFVGGLTGILFTEFVFTLAGAVAISAIVALTLSPMMCSKILPASEKGKNNFEMYIDTQFNKLHDRYKALLTRSFESLNVTAVFAVIIFIGIGVLYNTTMTELAPDEDQGLLLADLTTSPNASVYQTSLYSQDFYERIKPFKEVKHIYQLDGITNANGTVSTLNSSIAGIVFKPWDKRKQSTLDLLPKMEEQIDQIAGAKVALYQPSPLPGAVGLPVQFAIITTKPYLDLYEVSYQFFDKAQESGLFAYLDNDLKLDMLQANIIIDREKAAALGLQMADVSNVLSAALSQNYVNFFNLDGRAYQVIPQVMREKRLNYDDVLSYYITTGSGHTVQLATIATIETEVVPEQLNHFHEQHAATISGVLNSGITMGQAIDELEQIAEQILPSGYAYEYGGESRYYQQSSATLPLTFGFSMVIIFLSLAALFESFRDPLIILISVPMSIFGAMLFLNIGVGGASLNIYTQVGLVTLIGLISKHGILIVQFANSLQLEGKNKLEAITLAASIRLRPILMTTAAMVLGVIPLLLAAGPGAESRFNIGLVIASGISIGTLFTLFVLPAMYLFLAKEHHAPKAIA
ncbi:MAG: efflux RND transporter permease subunit [Gammaproteobacteria bacterium]|jgi:multidrug efflux pump